MFKILYAVVNDSKPEGFEDDVIFSEGEYQMLLFQSAISIEVDGEMRDYPPHTGIIYKPGQHVHYKSERGVLTYTWIRFDCDEPLFVEGYVPFGVPIYCDNYAYFLRYWEMVANENFWHHQSEEHIITDLMHIIFHWFHDSAFPTESSRYQNVLEDLRADIYAHPEYDWTLERMAEQVSMSTRSLQKLYKDFAHVSCIAEVIESRMTRAKMLLVQTRYDIGEISERCGYNNVEHFCRQFKRHESVSPSVYRKEHLAVTKH